MVTVFEKMKELRKEAVPYVDLKDYLNFLINENVQIEDLEKGSLPKEIKDVAKNFLENNFTSENGMYEFWKRFLESDFETLLENNRAKSIQDASSLQGNFCKHETTILTLNTGKRKENGEYEDDFVIYCGNCKNELFRMSLEGREMFDFVSVPLVELNMKNKRKAFE